jgi:hypothetical protein
MMEGIDCFRNGIGTIARTVVSAEECKRREQVMKLLSL